MTRVRVFGILVGVGKVGETCAGRSIGPPCEGLEGEVADRRGSSQENYVRPLRSEDSGA